MLNRTEDARQKLGYICLSLLSVSCCHADRTTDGAIQWNAKLICATDVCVVGKSTAVELQTGSRECRMILWYFL